MTCINRGCVIIRVADPYVEWAKGLDDSGMAPNPETDEPSVYLIPNFDNDAEAWQILAQCYEPIFEEELDAWHTDDSDWPQRRTFERFREWFHISFSSVVQDLVAAPIVHEDDA